MLISASLDRALEGNNAFKGPFYFELCSGLDLLGMFNSGLTKQPKIYIKIKSLPIL
jgi:hypothetical protein